MGALTEGTMSVY